MVRLSLIYPLVLMYSGLKLDVLELELKGVHEVTTDVFTIFCVIR